MTICESQGAVLELKADAAGSLVCHVCVPKLDCRDCNLLHKRSETSFYINRHKKSNKILRPYLNILFAFLKIFCVIFQTLFDLLIPILGLAFVFVLHHICGGQRYYLLEPYDKHIRLVILVER